jgi:nucleotide-binding universal stress UspA family protein
VTKILIGVDATARSEDAIAFGRHVAQATTAEVVVATVVRDGRTASDDARATVRRMSGLLTGIEPERIHTAVVPGRSPAQGLHEFAEAERPALLVVGSTHTGAIGRVRPGSTGERLLIGAPCAIAVAPYGFRTAQDDALRRIGVAYDGTREARAALEAGIAAARALRAALQVITVIPSDVYGAPALMAGPSYIVVAADAEADIRKDLDETVAGIPADVSATGVVLEGRPWRALAEATEELDLLLIGSRGYGPVQAVILGSTGSQLIRHAHCPVVALPRGARSGLDELFGTHAAAAA